MRLVSQYVSDRDHEFRLLGEGTAQTVVHNNPESSRTVASRLSHSKFRCHVLAFENTVMWGRRGCRSREYRKFLSRCKIEPVGIIGSQLLVWNAGVIVYERRLGQIMPGPSWAVRCKSSITDVMCKPKERAPRKGLPIHKLQYSRLLTRLTFIHSSLHHHGKKQ